jgi:hypothetical protein
MLLKKIYSNNDKNWENLYNKKLLNTNYYNKFLIRSSLLNNNNFNIIDNDSNFFNSSTLKLKNFIFSTHTNIEGCSINGKNIMYTNKFNNALKFKSFAKNVKVKNFSYVNSFYNLLKLKKTKQNNFLFLLKPVKGGFTCYSSGIVGFLPRSHAILSFLLIFNSLNNKKTKIKILESLNFILDKKNFINNFFRMRLPYSWGKAVLNSRFNKNSFGPGSQNKFSNRLNFVFLTKKNINTNKNNKTIIHEKNKNFPISTVSK